MIEDAIAPYWDTSRYVAALEREAEDRAVLAALSEQLPGWRW